VVMSKLERFFVVGLVVLVVLAVTIVVILPRLGQQPSPTEQPLAPGETETMSARVVEVLEEGTIEMDGGGTLPYQRLLLRVESGSLAGEEVEVEEGTVNIISQDRLVHVGDRVYLERAVGSDGDRFYISDFERTGPLFWIVTLFVGLVVLVGRGKGLRSLVGTLFSLVVIFAFIVPQIIAGQDPVVVSIAGSIVLLAVSNYLIYGWNPRAHAAVAGMVLSLVLTGVLAWLFVGWARLTGLSEEGGYLVLELGPGINLQGLLLGGIIIGSMGALDDVCVAQVSVVFELLDANPDLEWVDLFRRAFNVGRDHIAAMVNTLVLAYTGASLPLLLAFTLYQEPLWRRVNREPIAEEIVRTLVGSMGLVMAAPITSLIASLLARWMVRREEAGKQGSKGAEEQRDEE
ncbi:MAG: YibE/F family protein, partial [Anaerolineae bacterium]